MREFVTDGHGTPGRFRRSRTHVPDDRRGVPRLLRVDGAAGLGLPGADVRRRSAGRGPAAGDLLPLPALGMPRSKATTTAAITCSASPPTWCTTIAAGPRRSRGSRRRRGGGSIGRRKQGGGSRRRQDRPDRGRWGASSRAIAACSGWPTRRAGRTRRSRRRSGVRTDQPEGDAAPGAATPGAAGHTASTGGRS